MTEFPEQSIVVLQLSNCSQNTHGQQGTYGNLQSQVMLYKNLFDSNLGFHVTQS